MNKEAGRKIIAERVEEFEKNKAVLTKKGHGETNIRSNYIDIMFKALGWDMKSHYEVVREYSQRDKSTDGGTKKVDYAFKINGKLKFFIEAKEASVDLEKDKAAIFQAKRYAYSSNGKAPIVILTDFEEFRVFNVIKAPLMDNTDRELLKPLTMKYTEYLEKWDLLWDTFSREAVENGSLDKLRGKIDKNTKTMDVDFLEQITSWRESLAKNIAIRNENLNVDEINEAVQRILDRLVFIRNLEDREIEPENTLLDKTKKAENIYKSIIPIFNSLNTTYNGLLFKKHFSENIEVDDKTIRDIIRQMCYPVSPFQFDVIEPEILGRIYEKFLGSKIRLTDSHRAKIEEKIEVRKAGGVYYTPEYIVEYIVQNTVGKKIEGLTPEEIKKIKIVDPACGSGSFLIGAYSYLLDYHHQWYTENQKDKSYQADWYKTKDGEIKVRLDKRGEILRNNIFGVDIDKEATEVAIMSLYLKMLDDGFDKGERDLFFVKGSVLPDMIENIKCGNSLISTDYYKEKLDYNIDELKEIKPFDWEGQYHNIKFDCVIGNPPYFNINTISKHYFEYLKIKYSTIHTGYNDIMYYFIYRGMNLLNSSGILGFITSNYYLGNSYAKPLRAFLKDYISKIVNFKDYLIFQDANIHTNIIIATKNVIDDQIKYLELIDKSKFDQNNIDYSLDSFSLERTSLKDEWVITQSENISIIDKIKSNCIQLGDIANIEKGSSSGKNTVFTISYDFAEANNFEKELLRKNVKNGDIDKYIFNDRGNYLIYIDNDVNIKNYPNIYKYLIENKKILQERNEVKRELYHWCRLERPRDKSVFDSFEKIIVPYRADSNKFAYDNKQYFNDGGDIRAIVLNDNIEYNIKYILGILNSTFMNWYYGFIGKPKGNMREYFNEPMALIPIRKLDFSNVNDKKNHDSIVNLVEQIINAKNEYVKVKSESDKSLYNQKINLISKNIDELVYNLYDLTVEEIKIIESK